MSAFLTLKDGAQLFYKAWGTGKPIVFSHGWPLCADAWDSQMLFFLQQGFRVIAHDRRGHGRSSQTWERNTMDQYASDLNELIQFLDLKDAVLIGHSTGGGEVTRYVGRFGSKRVSKVVLVGAVPPLMLQTAKNPDGLPRQVFDNIRRNLTDNRSQFFRELAHPFFGLNRPGVKASGGLVDLFWLQGMMGGVKAEYDCIEQFSETDLTEDLTKIDVPTLILHGDDDQIVPIGTSSKMSAKLVPGAEFKVYPGGSHGLTFTHKDDFHRDVLAFIKKADRPKAGL